MAFLYPALSQFGGFRVWGVLSQSGMENNVVIIVGPWVPFKGLTRFWVLSGEWKRQWRLR